MDSISHCKTAKTDPVTIVMSNSFLAFGRLIIKLIIVLSVSVSLCNPYSFQSMSIPKKRRQKRIQSEESKKREKKRHYLTEIKTAKGQMQSKATPLTKRPLRSFVLMKANCPRANIPFPM